MITLFVIVVIATLVLAVTRAEGMRPLGLALVGMISLVLGARATAVFTETSILPLVDSIVYAQESKPGSGPVESKSTSDPVSADAETSIESAPAVEADDTPAGTSVTATADDVETTDGHEDVAETTETKPAEAVAGDENAASELSTPIKVETITNVEYLDRAEGSTPSWLETKPWSKDGVFFVPVASQLQISEADRDRELDSQIKAATDQYINRYLKNKHATTLMKLHSANAIPKVMGSFEEQVVVTAGTMHQAHALLSFDKDFHHAIVKEWDEVRATSRLMQTGLGAGVVLLLLSTMFSYFKLDTATRGYYTGRLQFAAAAAILAVIAVGVLFANYVPWM